jgi:hypothetical protein
VLRHNKGSAVTMGVLNVQVMISLGDMSGNIDTGVQAVRGCNIIGANHYTKQSR